MRVLVIEHHSFTDWRRQHSAGEVPGSLPYGLERLEHHGMTLLRLQDDRGWRARTAGFAEYRLGVPLLTPVRVARAASSVDAILTFFEDQAIGLGELKRRGHLSSKLVVVTCWLAERALSLPTARLTKYRTALAHADAIVCFSKNQPPILVNRLGLDPSRIHTLDFGVDPNFYQPADVSSGHAFALAAGSDFGRDYATLAAAVRATDVSVKLVCDEFNVRGIELPSNVEFVGRVSHTEYRTLLRDAAVVVLPTHPFAYPTGQTVLLEAMMSGKPVIASDTPAIRQYLPEGTGVLVRPAHSEELAAAIEKVLGHQALRRSLGSAARDIAVRRFTTNQMCDRLAAIIAA